MAKKKTSNGVVQTANRPKPSTSKTQKSDRTTDKQRPDSEHHGQSLAQSSLPNSSPAQAVTDKTSTSHSTESKPNSKARKSSKPTTPIQPQDDGENLDQRPIQPESTRQAEVKKEQGNVQFKSGKFSDAINSYSEAIALNPDNPAYLANRAAALMSVKNYRLALTDMQLVNSPKFVNPDDRPNPKNILRLVRCHLPLGQFYQAQQALSNLLNQSPDCVDAKREEQRLNKLQLILGALQRNRTRKDWSMVLFGLDDLQKELDCGDLKAKDWLTWKAEALCGQKKWEDAKVICNELVKSYPSDPEALYYRAKVIYSGGNLAATVAHCQEAMRCDPDFSSARNLLRQAKTIENLKEAGNSAFKASDFTTAIQKYLEARSIDPANECIIVTLDSNRAQALLKSNRNSEAIEVCDDILKVDQQHFKALRTRARAQKSAQDFDAAMVDFESALKVAPSAKEKTEIMNEIKTTKVLIARGKYVDHYKVLGVPRNASDDEIKKAFRKQSLIHHPDKGGNEEKFKEVNESYTVLQDPQARRNFDQIDPDNPQGSSDTNLNPFGFDEGFGWDGIFTAAGGGRTSFRSHTGSDQHFRSHAHSHYNAHGFNSNPFFTSARGF